MTTHEWRDRDEDNRLIFYRAKHHSGVWTFHSRPKDEEHWTNYETPPLELLESFRDVLWNKIQRRRAPEEQIAIIDAMLDELRSALPQEEE
ncbi:MAG: hypothetical protein P1V20_27455 [Verrucomicrobiales bacterium]|nr:hypothetical protein [Verrucomicrobiales bacterium]